MLPYFVLFVVGLLLGFVVVSRLRGWLRCVGSALTQEVGHMSWRATKESQELVRNPANARKIVEELSKLSRLASSANDSTPAPPTKEITLNGETYVVADVILGVCRHEP